MQELIHQSQNHVPVTRRPSQGCNLMTYKPPPSQQSYGYEREFIEAMHQSGISFREKIIADGTIQRFAPGGKGNKDGWYVFYGLAGVFGDWRQNIRKGWSVNAAQNPNLDKEQFFEQIEKAKKAAEEERQRKYEETSVLALKKWNSCSETGSSPYLVNKKVETCGIRFDGEDIVVPLRDITGKLWSFQRISPDGMKRFLVGGRKKGCFHMLGFPKEGKSIYVTEGYATGASVYMATQQVTAVAFDAGNLESVLGELKKCYPGNLIVIAGDDDMWGDSNVGRTKVEEAAQKYGCSIVFPIFKNVDSKPTDFNDLHVLEGLDEVKAQLQQAKSFFAWPELKPLYSIKQKLLPVIPLPPELIPEPYQAWLVDIAERMQCPLDYVAVGALIVTASIIGAGCSIRPKRADSWTIIPNLWGGIIGAPSSLKSPALKEILKPLEALETEAFEAYEKAQHNYLVELEAHKATKEVIKKDMAKSASTSDTFGLDAAKERLRHLPEPQEPFCKRYITNDATIEKMHELLSRNPRGLLLFRDELLGLLASWEKEGHESDRTFYLEAWNGYGSKTTDRIGRGTIHTKNLCVSLLGSTQPSKLLGYFQHVLNGLENDGLLQRFQLLVYPDEPKIWKLIDRKPNDQAREQVSRIITKLANIDFTAYGALLDPHSGIPYFQFDTQAQEFFYEWLTELEEKLRNSSDEPIILEHLAKYRKLLPSLALVFHLIDMANGSASGPITANSFERAAGWCDYLKSHARRIYNLALSPSYQAARNLARKIQEGELKRPFDLREVYRKQWALLKTKEEAEMAIGVLIENGWILEHTISEGGRTKNQYLINPTINPRGSHE